MLFIRFAEVVILCHFIILAFLWLLRDPKFIDGWAIAFEKGLVRQTEKKTRHTNKQTDRH